jgi:Kelch motif
LHWVEKAAVGWEASLPTPQTRLAAAAGHDGKIYAMGGAKASDSPVGTMEAYDPTTNSWSTQTPMPTARAALAGATGHDGKIYAIGGVICPSSIVFGTVEAYDPASNSWSTEAPMPTARYDVAAATGSDGKIYAIGGATSNACANASNAVGTVEAYDPPTNSWSTREPMPTARQGLVAAAGNDGKIYAIGGVNSDGTPVGTMEAYDPATNSWSTQTPMPTERFHLAAATGHDGKIYAIGGLVSSIDSPVSTMEAYDQATNSWIGAAAPLTVSVKLRHGSIKAGQKQTVTVVTAPNVQVTIVVRFPDGSKKTKTGTADSNGNFTWSFKQPPGKTKGTNHSAKVTVTVTRVNEPSKSASKRYKIN